MENENMVEVMEVKEVKEVKKTQREMFTEIIAKLDPENDKEYIEFLESRIAQLNKKSGSKAKTDETQGEVKGMILEALENADKPMRNKEIAVLPAFLEKGYSAQKIQAQMTKLVNDGVVVRTEEKKGQPVYTLAQV